MNNEWVSIYYTNFLNFISFPFVSWDNEKKAIVCLKKQKEAVKMEKRIDKVFTAVKELDAEIRTIEYPYKENLDYIVEIGLYESIGERGEILTLLFESLPSEAEIIADLKTNLRMTKIDLRNNFRSGREDKYLNILNRLELG